MSERAHRGSTHSPDARHAQALRAGLVVFAFYHLALAAYMAIAPHSFYTQIGPFGARNDHYVRDVASFTAALGFGFAIAVRRPSWRVPVLAVTTVQFALHSLNHLLDIGKAHPDWTGYLDFFTLLVATALLAWLWRVATSASYGLTHTPSFFVPPPSSASPPSLAAKENHMTRLQGVSPKGKPLIGITYRIARRELRRMTGKPLLTPDIPVRAHNLRLLMSYAKFEKGVASGTRVPEQLRALAVLKSAVMQGCEMCQDIGSFEARANGVSDDQMHDLYRYRDSEHFDELERLVLDLAVGMTLTPVQVGDELIEALSRHLDARQLVELVNLIAVENLRSRFNAAFALGAAGFSEGMVCARMEPAPSEAVPAGVS